MKWIKEQRPDIPKGRYLVSVKGVVKIMHYKGNGLWVEKHNGYVGYIIDGYMPLPKPIGDYL